jgi:hypothetical protein
MDEVLNKTHVYGRSLLEDWRPSVGSPHGRVGVSVLRVPGVVGLAACDQGGLLDGPRARDGHVAGAGDDGQLVRTGRRAAVLLHLRFVLRLLQVQVDLVVLIVEVGVEDGRVQVGGGGGRTAAAAARRASRTRRAAVEGRVGRVVVVHDDVRAVGGVGGH